MHNSHKNKGITRRDFLLLGLAAGAAGLAVPRLLGASDSAPAAGLGSVMSIDAGGLIRPPGALKEKDFRAKCISCGVCANVCHTMKYDAIALSGRADWGFGTPYIKEVRDFPCALCMACPPRCPTGALVSVPKEKVHMGMALIDFGLCFGWNGDVCLSCSKACPLGAKVFDFYNTQWGNQPLINEACVGCGLCSRYCPMGGSAIKIVTMEKYAEISAGYKAQFEALRDMPHEERYNVIYTSNLPVIMERGRLVEREFR